MSSSEGSARPAEDGRCRRTGPCLPFSFAGTGLPPTIKALSAVLLATKAKNIGPDFAAGASTRRPFKPAEAAVPRLRVCSGRQHRHQPDGRDDQGDDDIPGGAGPGDGQGRDDAGGRLGDLAAVRRPHLDRVTAPRLARFGGKGHAGSDFVRYAPRGAADGAEAGAGNAFSHRRSRQLRPVGRRPAGPRRPPARSRSATTRWTPCWRRSGRRCAFRPAANGST